MSEVVLGIDIGTSGVRMAAVTRGLHVVAFAEATLPAPDRNGARLTQDAERWWEAVTHCFTSLDLKGHDLSAVAVDGTSGTIVAIDDAGKPLEAASMYNDSAEPEHVNAVSAVASPETAALGSTSPLARAMRFSKGRVVHQADWIAGKLSGDFSFSDENNALKSGYDPVTRSWPAWISKTGLDVSRFPRVIATGTRIGTIDAGIAKQFELPGDVAIVAGTTDGCAAFLASGANEVGDGVTSLGTTITLKLLSRTPVFAPAYGIYSHRIGDQWLAGGASNAGGVVLAQHFSNEQIDKLSNDIPDRDSGLDYYPIPKPGERFPINDAGLAPRLSPRPDDDAAFLHGILEGFTRIEALGYQRLAELGASPLRSMRTVGGGAKNAAWSRMRMKAFKVPALQSLNDHAAVGTARLAWRGIDVAA